MAESLTTAGKLCIQPNPLRIRINRVSGFMIGSPDCINLFPIQSACKTVHVITHPGAVIFHSGVADRSSGTANHLPDSANLLPGTVILHAITVNLHTASADGIPETANRHPASANELPETVYRHPASANHFPAIVNRHSGSVIINQQNAFPSSGKNFQAEVISCLQRSVLNQGEQQIIIHLNIYNHGKKKRKQTAYV